MFAFVTLTFAQDPSGHPTPSPTPHPTMHIKKDETPGKRFKENKAAKGPLKKDGTPDMRLQGQ